MQNKIRCINDNTGQVRYLSESVAKNRGFMKNYGWRIEDLQEAEEDKVAEAAPIETAPKRKTKPKQTTNGN